MRTISLRSTQQQQRPQQQFQPQVLQEGLQASLRPGHNGLQLHPRSPNPGRIVFHLGPGPARPGSARPGEKVLRPERQVRQGVPSRQVRARPNARGEQGLRRGDQAARGRSAEGPGKWRGACLARVALREGREEQGCAEQGERATSESSQSQLVSWLLARSAHSSLRSLHITAQHSTAQHSHFSLFAA